MNKVYVGHTFGKYNDFRFNLKHLVFYESVDVEKTAYLPSSYNVDLHFPRFSRVLRFPTAKLREAFLNKLDDVLEIYGLATRLEEMV